MKFLQVAHEQRLRSLPLADDSRASTISTKRTEFAISRETSGIARPSFAKMYEFIDISLESKLARLVNEAVSSRMEANGKLFHSDNDHKLGGQMNQKAESVPSSPLSRPLVSISPAPQPSPLMHSRAPEYPSPTPQLSDISSFGNSFDRDSPSTFSNIALGWQDSMGLAINMSTEDSPITRALKQITEHLAPSNAKARQQSPPQWQQRQQLSDEYSKMIEVTLAALSPNSSLSPNRQNRGIVPRASQSPDQNTRDSACLRQLHINDLNPEEMPEIQDLPTLVEDASAQSGSQNRTALSDSVRMLAADETPEPCDALVAAEPSYPTQVQAAGPNDLRQTVVRLNLLEIIHEQDIEEHSHIGSDAAKKEDKTQDVDKSHNFDMPDQDSHHGFVQEMGRVTIPAIQETLTPEKYPLASSSSSSSSTPSSIAGRLHQHSRQGCEAIDLQTTMSERISIRKREVTALGEGIDSIRGISSLLEMYTSVPSAKSSQTNGAGDQTRLLADSSPTASQPQKSISEGPLVKVDQDDRDIAAIRSPEHGQRLVLPIKTLPLMLPDIAVSPESPCLTSVNMVASILRDALPVKGLELSQDDSDLDEGNISGDELEQCDISAGEGMYEA